MKRLLEVETAPDARERYLAKLVRASAPTYPDAFRKQRVWSAIAHRGGPRSRRTRPAVVAVALIAAASGAAALNHQWPRPAIPPASAPAPTTREYQPAPPPLPEAKRQVEVPSEKVVDTPAAPAAPSLTARAKLPTGPVKKPNSDDSATMVEAIRALRTDHDPDRAGDLLSRYMATYPNGALYEDALALSIEAAVLRHDARAQEYARRYLSRYPDGRFAKVARKALPLGAR